MAQENIAVVRAALEAWNRDDWDAFLDNATPDFELDMSRAMGPFRGVYAVHQLRRFWESFAANWESRWFEPREFIDAGEFVVVPVTLHTRGRDGIEVSARITHLWTFRGGSIARMCMYQERREALEAAGLAE